MALMMRTGRRSFLQFPTLCGDSGPFLERIKENDVNRSAVDQLCASNEKMLKVAVGFKVGRWPPKIPKITIGRLIQNDITLTLSSVLIMLMRCSFGGGRTRSTCHLISRTRGPSADKQQVTGRWSIHWRHNGVLFWPNSPVERMLQVNFCGKWPIWATGFHLVSIRQMAPVRVENEHEPT